MTLAPPILRAPTGDAAAGLNALLQEVDHIKLDPIGTYRLDSQLIIPAGVTLDMGGATLLRTWAGTVGNKYGNATIRNQNAPTIAQMAVNPGPWVPSTVDDGITLIGGRLDAESSADTGCGYYLVGVSNLRLVDTTVVRTYQDWAYCLGGDVINGRGLRVLENSAVWEDGVHIIYGSNIDIEADHIHCGDDAVAFGTNWNLPIRDAEVRVGTVLSERGNAVKLVQNREGSTAGFPAPTAKLERLTVRFAKGQTGLYRNGLVHTVITGPGLVDDVTLDGLVLDHGAEVHDGVNPFGYEIRYVSRLKLLNPDIRRARRSAIHLQDCPDFEIRSPYIPDSGSGGSFPSLHIENSTGKLLGGHVARSGTYPVSLTGASKLLAVAATIADAGDSTAAVRLEGTSQFMGEAVTLRRKVGATTSQGIRFDATTTQATLTNCDLTEIDRPLSLVAVPAEAKIIGGFGTVGTRTIVSGSFSHFGHLDVGLLGEGGVTDTLSTVTGGVKGMRLRLRNGETNPAAVTITLVAGTGSNQLNIGTNYLLDTAAKFVDLEFTGTNWVQLVRA